MSLTRGLVLIAAFATTWGLLAGCTCAFLRMTFVGLQGIIVPLASVGVAFFEALGVFGIIDRFMIKDRVDESVRSVNVNSLKVSPAINTPFKHWARLTACLSMACGLFGILPLWAPPAFVTGLLLSFVAIALAYKQKMSYLPPAFGLVTNVVALSMWPAVLGFFPTETGYEFRYGKRSVAADLSQPCIIMLFIEFPSTNRDRVDLLIDGKMENSWEDTTHRKEGSRLEPHVFIPHGFHQVAIRWNGTTIHSEIVQVPREENPHRQIFLWITLKSQQKVIYDGPRILEN